MRANLSGCVAALAPQARMVLHGTGVCLLPQVWFPVTEGFDLDCSLKGSVGSALTVPVPVVLAGSSRSSALEYLLCLGTSASSGQTAKPRAEGLHRNYVHSCGRQGHTRDLVLFQLEHQPGVTSGHPQAWQCCQPWGTTSVNVVALCLGCSKCDTRVLASY